jgi:aminobenzoyl-glutamate utilization protein B
MNKLYILLCFIIPFTLNAQRSKSRSISNTNKQLVIQSIDAHKGEFANLSDSIWSFAELDFHETKSALALARYATRNGFNVRQGVAGMPTAIIAEFGSGHPIIGVLGEFDALPGLSQRASAHVDPLVAGGSGHGCGHNLLGVGSLAAAIAIKELIAEKKLSGTIRFYGTPAEEGGGGKVYLARQGVFNDLDACFDWHPDAMTESITQSSQAIIDNEIIFKGKTAHAAGDPWMGKSALDAAELFMHGVSLLREHVKPSVRMHYSILETNKAANVVPDFVRLSMNIRDSKIKSLTELNEQMKDLATGAALMAGVQVEVKLVNGYHEILVNRSGAEVMQRNLELLGPINFPVDEVEFAMKIQEAMDVPGDGLYTSIHDLRETEPDPDHGSSDVGDVSWIAPEIGLTATTAPKGIPWHSWGVVATSGMSIGHRGMLYAAKAMSMTIIDLFENPELLKKIRTEFSDRKGSYEYKAMLPDGPPPVSR